MDIKMIAGFFVCLIIVMITMPSFIRFLKKLSFKQSISEYALEDDKKKAGTPIMGGALFILAPVIVTLLLCWKDLGNLDIWIILLVFAGYGLIGFVDDYLIAVKKNNEGLTPVQKFTMQVVLAAVFFLVYRSHAQLEIALPFASHPVNLGWGYFILILLMFTGSSNAVNLTDGMDGLAGGVTLIALIPYLIFSILQKRLSVSIFICCLLGALTAYLYYNKKPARIFMGDTGSLALGGVLAGLAMITKTELLLVIIAGIPVIETICVIIQQVAVRTGHHKVFVYTPIHYAFRIKGMSETKIVRMFWLIEACFAILGLLIYLF